MKSVPRMKRIEAVRQLELRLLLWPNVNDKMFDALVPLVTMAFLKIYFRRSLNVSQAAATKPAPTEHAPEFSKYVTLVAEGDIIQTLEQQIENSLSLLQTIPSDKGNFRYAPDKWSVKELLGHLIDSERIFSFRALHFARNDQTPLPGYEQNDYVREADFDRRNLTDMAEEFATVRRATIQLFRPLNETEWLRHGKANEIGVTVRALAYIIAGHELHHMGVLRSRYLQS